MRKVFQRSKLGFYVPFNSQGHIGTGPQGRYFKWIDKMLGKLSSGQGCPSKKRIFGHVTSLIGEMSLQHIQKNFPGLLHTPAKYEKNPPYGCKAIAKRKCGSGSSGGVASPIYKQVSLVGYLIIIIL